MTATQQPRPGGAWAATALRRAIGALRLANDELLRANEAIFRPVGEPRGSGPVATTRATPSAGAGADGGSRPPGSARAGGGDSGRAA
jgi:hypothetical protein